MKPLFIACTAVLLLTAFNTKKKNRLKLPDEFTYIPGGTMSDILPDSGVNHGKIWPRISFNPFYISRYEISNLQYRQFYNEVSHLMTEEEKEQIACDTLGWRTALTYCQPIVEYYYRHPAYNNYPAVNISYEGAAKYCEWLQQKIQKDNPAYEIEVKLPEKNQWIWAAMGGRSQAMFPWGNYYLRNKKGEFMCNFKRVGDGAIYRNRLTGKPEVAEGNFEVSGTGGLSERAFYTAHVKSYYPNDYGLFNMCGNAAEMITEKGVAIGGSWDDYGGDVQIRAESKYDGPLPTVGFRPVVIAKLKQGK